MVGHASSPWEFWNLPSQTRLTRLYQDHFLPISPAMLARMAIGKTTMLSKSLEGTAKFNHIGIAVKDFEKSITFYEHLGYEASKPLVDSHQNVELVMLCSQVSPDIELIKPINEKSPV